MTFIIIRMRMGMILNSELACSRQLVDNYITKYYDKLYTNNLKISEVFDLFTTRKLIN